VSLLAKAVSMLLIFTIAASIPAFAQSPQLWITQPTKPIPFWVDSFNGSVVGAGGSILALYRDQDKVLAFVDMKSGKVLAEIPAAALLMDVVDRVIDLAQINAEWSGFLVLGRSAAAVVDPYSGAVHARFSKPGSRVGFSINTVYMYDNEVLICLSLPELKAIGAVNIRYFAVDVITSPESFGISRWDMLVRYTRSLSTDPSSPPMATTTARSFMSMVIDALNKTLMAAGVMLNGTTDHALYIPYRSGSLDYRDIYQAISTEIAGGWCIQQSPIDARFGVSYMASSPFTMSFTAYGVNASSGEQITLYMDYIFREDTTLILANGTDLFTLLNITTPRGAVSTASIITGAVEMYMLTPVSLNKIFTKPSVRAGPAGGFDTFAVLYQPYGMLPVAETYGSGGLLLGSTRAIADLFSFRVLGSSYTSVAIWNPSPFPGQSSFMVVDTSKPYFASVIYSVRSDAVEVYPSSGGGFLFISSVGSGGDVEVGFVFGSSVLSKRILGGAVSNARSITISTYNLSSVIAYIVASSTNGNTTAYSFADTVDFGSITVVAPANASLSLTFNWNGFTRTIPVQPNTSMRIPLGSSIVITSRGSTVFTGVATRELTIDLMMLAQARQEQLVQLIPPELYIPRQVQEVGSTRGGFVFVNLSGYILKKISETGSLAAINDFYIAVAEEGVVAIYDRLGNKICSVPSGEFSPSYIDFYGRSIVVVQGFWGVSILDASTCSIVASYLGPTSISPDMLAASWSGNIVKLFNALTGDVYMVKQVGQQVTAAYPVAKGVLIVIAGSDIYAVTATSMSKLNDANETVISHVYSPAGIAASTQGSVILYTPYTGLVKAQLSEQVDQIYWLAGYSVEKIVALIKTRNWVWGVKTDKSIAPLIAVQGKSVLGVTRSGVVVGSPNSSVVQLYDFAGQLRASIMLPFPPIKALILDRSLVAIGSSAYYTPDIGSSRYTLTITYISPKDGMDVNVSIDEIGFQASMKPGESRFISLAYQANLSVRASAKHMEDFTTSVEVSDRNRFPVVEINMKWKLYKVDISVYVATQNTTEPAPKGSGAIIVKGDREYRLEAPGGTLMLRFGNYTASFISSYYSNTTTNFSVEGNTSVSINTTKVYTDIIFQVSSDAGYPLKGAKVSVEGFGSDTTNASGTSVIRMVPIGAMLNVSIGAVGYYTVEKQIQIVDMAVYREMLRRITCQLTINVRDTSGAPSSAEVFIVNESGAQVASATVAFSMNMSIPYGSYMVKTPAAQDQKIMCTSGENITVDIIVPPPPPPITQTTQQPQNPITRVIGSQQALATLIFAATAAIAIGIIAYRLYRKRA